MRKHLARGPPDESCPDSRHASLRKRIPTKGRVRGGNGSRGPDDDGSLGGAALVSFGWARARGLVDLLGLPPAAAWCTRGAVEFRFPRFRWRNLGREVSRGRLGLVVVSLAGTHASPWDQ